MDLAFRPEHERFRAELREWLAVEVKRPWSRECADPELDADALVNIRRNFQRALNDAGYLGMDWPTEWGGRGATVVEKAIFQEEMQRADAPPIANGLGLALLGPALIHHGTEEQRRRFIPKMLSCDEIWCQGFSEPGSGSDLASLQTRARRDGDAYVIEGHKVWTTLGVFADHMILLARTNPDEPRHGGISYFLSPMKAPGIEVQPLVKITGELGFNQVIFSEARIPADTLLGHEGEGWKLAIETLQFERGAQEGGGGRSGGTGGTGLDELIALARTCSRDGQPVLDDPVVRDRIAAFAIEAAAMRASRARLRVPELNIDRPMALPLMTKLVGSEWSQRLSDFACELQGWDETLWRGDPKALQEGRWQHAYLRSFEGTIAGGTSEIQRNILGEKVLGLPKSR